MLWIKELSVRRVSLLCFSETDIFLCSGHVISHH